MSFRFVSTLILALWATAGCRPAPVPADTLRVGATPVPHALILEQVKPVLAAQGIRLEVLELTDYLQPNLALAEGELEANFFQHGPYLEQFNADRGTRLVSAGKVHLEPLGVYSRRHPSLGALPVRATVGVPNDPTNGSRALRLLARAGLLELRPGVDAPTLLDVVANPRQLTLRELESAQLPRSLPDVDAAVINTNYALEAGLDPIREALIREGGESPYANLVVTRQELISDPRIRALVEALQSERTQAFITERFGGSILPVSGG